MGARTMWTKLQTPDKVLRLSAFFLSEVACFLLIFPVAECFKKFSMTSTIEDDLDGNVLNVVNPLGWVVLVLCLMRVLLLCLIWGMGRARYEDPPDEERTALAAPPHERASPLPHLGHGSSAFE